MPLTKKDAPGATKAAEELAEEKGVDVQELEGSGAKGKVTKADVEEVAPAHAGDLTPSAYALAEVGEFKGEPGSAAAAEHGEKYQAAKRKRRFGL